MKPDWWTLALQTVNVLILLWVLQRFLFKPVLAMIAQRQEAVRSQLAEALQTQRRAEDERALLADERRTLAGSREQALATARAEAQQARDAMMAQVASDIEQRKSAATQALQHERDEAAAALRTRAATLAGELARRLLERLPAANWNGCFIDGAQEKLAELPRSEVGLPDSGDDARIEVVSATPLDAADQNRVNGLLADALGAPAHAVFSVDAGLIAGIELRLRHLVVRNHWAADLQRLLQRLEDHDDAARDA